MNINRRKRKKRFCYLILSLVFLLILLFSFKFDPLIVVYGTRLQNFWLDNFMLWITYLSSSVVVLFILTSLFLWHEHKRRWILPLWLSLALSSAVSFVIKLIIARPRPYQIGYVNTLPVFINTIAAWNSSFPSLHAAIAFSALPVLDKEFPYFKFVWLGFACLVAFSRVYFALHFLSDVLIGAVLGYVIGLVFVKLEEKYKYSKILGLRRK